MEKIYYYGKDITFKYSGDIRCLRCSNLVKITKKNEIVGCSHKGCDVNKLKSNERIDFLIPIDKLSFCKDQKLNKIKSRNRLCIEYYLKKGFNLDEGLKIISEIQSKSSKMVKNRVIISKDYLHKLGYNDEQIKYLRRSPITKQYWMEKGYSEEESEIKTRNEQSKRSNSYAEKRKVNPENYVKCDTTKIDYYLNKGYSYDEAKIKLSNRQKTFSMDICIKKYGEIKGKEIFNQRQKK